MAEVEYIVTSSDVGRVFPIADGYLISLVQSRPPSGDAYARPWAERHLLLRDTRSPRALFSLDVTIARPPPLVIGRAYYWLTNSSIRFFGDLRLVCMPVGAEFEIIISDIPVTPRASIKMPFWYGNQTPRNPPSPRLETAAPPLRIAAPVASTMSAGG